jgi:hypothetical protein
VKAPAPDASVDGLLARAHWLLEQLGGAGG